VRPHPDVSFLTWFNQIHHVIDMFSTGMSRY